MSTTHDPENTENRGLSKLDPQPRERHADSDDRAEEILRPPSKDQLLAELNLLKGCVAAGVLPPAKANSMRGIYATMLSHLDNSSAGGGGAIPDEHVLKVLRQNPELLKFIKPLLTKGQFDLIVREAPND
jgi:hypothetical protein